MRDLTPDARLLLAAFAEANGPVDWWDLIERLAPETEDFQAGWTRPYKAWLHRRNHLEAEVMLLLRDELLVELPNGPEDAAVITAAGREALAASVGN